MNTLNKTFVTFLMLLTLTAAHANQPNIIGLCPDTLYKITEVSATKGTQSATLQYTLSPNNANELVLKTENLDTEDLMYMIQNAQGLVLKSSRIESNQITINLTDWVFDTYFLVVSNDRVSKTFKIVKKVENNSVVAMGK